MQIQTFRRNKHLDYHQVLFWSGDAQSSEIKKVISLPSCWSAWLQQWAGPDLKVLFCSADWSWRGTGLNFMKITSQRGDREPEPEPESLLGAEFSQSWPGSKHTHTLVLKLLTVTWAACLFLILDILFLKDNSLKYIFIRLSPSTAMAATQVLGFETSLYFLCSQKLPTHTNPGHMSAFIWTNTTNIMIISVNESVHCCFKHKRSS